MAKRILTAIVAIPLVVYVLWKAPPSVFVVLIAAAVVLGIREFLEIAEKMGCQGQPWIGWIGGVLIVWGFWSDDPGVSILVVAAVMAGAMIGYMIERRPLEASLRSTSATLAAVIYVGVFMGYLVSLRMAQSGGIENVAAKLLSFFFLVIWAGDSVAMLVGRTLGKHPLVPVLSPKKTVEGGLGGLLGSLAAAALACAWFFPELQLRDALGLGFIMGIVGQVGDWSESMLKRGAKIKDAASLIPGHGGILDRLDSMLFNAPILYYYYKLFLAS